MNPRWTSAGIGWIGLTLLAGSCSPGILGTPETVEAVRGPLEVWSVYDGTLESRNVEEIMYLGGGPATIMELAPEGARVQAGDVLVRFDSAQIENDLLKMERDAALAAADLESLENAKLPLELHKLENNLLNARTDYDEEKQYLEDSRQLMEENLVSEQEIRQQEAKVATAKANRDRLEQQLELTRKYLHPSALERARATLASARQELAMAKEKLAQCVVKSPVVGLLVYKPVHVGGDFRTVRVGDTLYRNQAFLALPDMATPIVLCDVPEAELARVRIGARVVVVPVAYPDLRLDGTVESIGSMAQNMAGRPGVQKYFRVQIALPQSDETLRAGMSVRAHILSASSPEALLLPRRAVQWDGDTAGCEVAGREGRERRTLRLGAANDQYFEVLDGLAAGERVMLP